MDLLITDVTEMHGGNYCVAGWCAHELRMIRPLPGGANWTAGLLAQAGVVPGAVVRVRRLNVQHPGLYPHTTEDTVVDPTQIGLVSPPPFNWFGVNSPVVSPSIAAGFDNQVEHNSMWNGAIQGVYVRSGARTPSLTGLNVPSNRLGFLDEFGKLKATINDGDSVYKIAVSSRRMKEAWRMGGQPALNAALPNSPQYHLRIGLARAFPEYQCYMMLNGVL